MKHFVLAKLACTALLATPPQAHAAHLNFTIHNNSDQLLCYVYVREADTTEWSGDLIDACIEPWESSLVDTLSQDGYCLMDILAQYGNGDEKETSEAFDACEGTDIYFGN